MHDVVDPAAAEEGSEEVAEGVWDVEEAEDEGWIAVRGEGEGMLQGDVEDVEGAKGYGGVVDCVGVSCGEEGRGRGRYL